MSASEDSVGARLLSNMSDFVVDEKFCYPQSKGNTFTHPELDFTGIGHEVGNRLDGAGIGTESGKSCHYECIREGGSTSKMNYFLNKTDVQENYSEIGMEDMANTCASENARHSHRHYPSPADICMADDQPAITRPVSSIISSQGDRTIFDSKIYADRLRSLYPEDIGKLLNMRFDDIRGLTCRT